MYVVRERRALLHSVIPFFERVPLLSSKRLDFEKSADIVRNMGRHLTPAGFAVLLEVAMSMNGGRALPTGQMERTRRRSRRLVRLRPR